MELTRLHRRAVEYWAARVAAVKDDEWDKPTPCTQWSVRDLVNHVVGEELWTVPLVRGATIQEVGGQFDGDVLGDDPLERARMAAVEAAAIVDAIVPGGGRVQLSYGEEDMGEYVRQLCADHLIHGWDLAAATGGDTVMDSELVSEVGTWFAERESMYRSGGAVGPRTQGAGDPQSDLLAGFGRTSGWGPNHAALARFSAAFGSGNVEAIMAQMTQDCVFESTGPAPDGQRHVGRASVRAVWEQFFGGTVSPTFIDEEMFMSGDRALVRWRFTWTTEDGSEGHVRGVDVLRFRDGLVSEKFSYVKG
ncbi:MAG: TIGR03086 family metal-binding protein [Dermatophilaceae bacterium]